MVVFQGQHQVGRCLLRPTAEVHQGADTEVAHLLVRILESFAERLNHELVGQLQCGQRLGSTPADVEPLIL